jgi:hypothetical protein
MARTCTAIRTAAALCYTSSDCIVQSGAPWHSFTEVRVVTLLYNASMTCTMQLLVVLLQSSNDVSMRCSQCILSATVAEANCCVNTLRTVYDS